MNTSRIYVWPMLALVAAFLFCASAIAVFAASPAVSVTGGSTPLATISVSGSGFAANEPVHVILGLSSGNTTTNAAGSFSGASLTIPNVPSGNYIVIAVGQNSGLVAFTYIYVSAFFPTVAPSAWYINPGSTLTWSGSGFAPNETITIKDASNTQLGSFNAGSDGSFSKQAASMVPYAAHGATASYTVSGVQSGTTIAITISVANLYPYASPSTWYALPGTNVTFSGAGFGGGEGVSLYVGTNTSPVAHWSADATGSFTGQGSTMLAYGLGTADYRLVGDSSGGIALAPITRASFYPSLSPSSYYSAPGSTITIGGSGFAPNEDVTIRVGTSGVSGARTNALGAFSGVSIRLPATPNTTPLVSAIGSLSQAMTSYTMAIGAYYSWMTLSTYYANGGSPQIISGHNFLSGETVTATASGQTLGSGVANTTGDVTINATVPFVAPGPVTIKTTGGSSGATATSDMTVAQVWTDLQLASYAGAPGAAVRFVGHGYLPNDPIVVTADRVGSSTVATFTADATGNFDDSSFHIPSGLAEGNLIFTVKGTHSFDTKTITYYVTH